MVKLRRLAQQSGMSDDAAPVRCSAATGHGRTGEPIALTNHETLLTVCLAVNGMNSEAAL